MAEPDVYFPFKKNWWPAPVTLISCGINRPDQERGANIWVVGVLGGPIDDPPLLTISPRTSMYSYSLMKEYGEFVVNFPAPNMIREMEYCGTNTGLEVDKWKACGFTPAPGRAVQVPSIAECPVNLECRIESDTSFTTEAGEEAEHRMILGRIVGVRAHEKYLVHGELQWDMVDTIYRARPRTWRALGPVLGYDTRKAPLVKPREAADLIEQRTSSLAALAETIRATPYPSQTAKGLGRSSSLH